VAGRTTAIVTATNGKSTTTTMLAAAVRTLGVGRRQRRRLEHAVGPDRRPRRRPDGALRAARGRLGDRIVAPRAGPAAQCSARRPRARRALREVHTALEPLGDRESRFADLVRLERIAEARGYAKELTP